MYDMLIHMRKLFTRKRLDVFSDLFINLAAGWFGVVFIVPGITQFRTFDDYFWLTKNVGFGMVSLYISIILKEKRG